MKVLELGCGTGEFTELLASKTNEWIATDFSNRVEDATALTFDKNSFDAVRF